MKLTENEVYRIKRQRQRITLKEIADKLNLHLSVISRYERHLYDLKADKVKAYQAFIDSK